MNRVGIYLRLSLDRSGEGFAVERQEADCRELVTRHGWQVEYVLTDSSISATNGKHRPAYVELKRLVTEGCIDTVVTWNHDRLLRLPRELEEWIPICEARDVPTYTVKAGHYDLTTPSGRAVARTLAAWANYETETAKMRMLAARVQIAEKGGRHKVSRVYGWADDGIAIRESEAIIVRDMAARIIAGDSPTSIAAKLNERQIPTIKGNNIWHGITVKKMASRASNAAIREHKGVLHYNGQWQPIMTVETWERVNIALDSNKTMQYKRGAGRKYLLTGYAFCECGSKLSATVGSGNRKASYRCHRTRSHDHSIQGCGQLSRQIVPLEDLVSKAILMRLNSPALMSSLTERKDDRTHVTALLSMRNEQQSRIDNLISSFYTGKSVLDDRQFAMAKMAAQDELDDINRQLSQLTSHQALANIDLTQNLTDLWGRASLSWKRNIAELLIDKIIVHKYEAHAKIVYYGKSRFDPALISIQWRV